MLATPLAKQQHLRWASPQLMNTLLKTHSSDQKMPLNTKFSLDKTFPPEVFKWYTVMVTAHSLPGLSQVVLTRGIKKQQGQVAVMVVSYTSLLFMFPLSVNCSEWYWFLALAH